MTEAEKVPGLKDRVKAWAKKRALPLVGTPVAASVMIWSYSTFITKEDAEARFSAIDARAASAEIRVVSQSNQQIMGQFSILQGQLNQLHTTQLETNRRIDELLRSLPRHTAAVR